MTHSIFSSEFSIYKIQKSENLYIAIPKAFARIIRQYVMEYNELISVPSDKKVKGIIFNDQNSYNAHLEEHNQVSDVSINQLAFDNYSG